MNTDRVALITGTSSGIGQAVAVGLLKEGFRVFGTSRKPISGEIARGMTTVRLDVTDDTSVSEAVAKVIGLAGRIDVLINNAGLGVVGGAEESSMDQAKHLFDTNVFGTIRMMQAVLPHMRANGSGTILNLSSILGLIPAPFVSLYAATKFAIEGYSESVDHEVRSMGVRVVAIEPGPIRTSFDQNMMSVDAPLPEYRKARERALANMTEMVGSAEEPEVVVKAVLAALRAESPRLRYTAGKVATRLGLARRLLPASMFDKALRRSMHLDA